MPSRYSSSFRKFVVLPSCHRFSLLQNHKKHGTASNQNDFSYTRCMKKIFVFSALYLRLKNLIKRSAHMPNINRRRNKLKMFISKRTELHSHSWKKIEIILEQTSTVSVPLQTNRASFDPNSLASKWISMIYTCCTIELFENWFVLLLNFFLFCET